MIIYAFIQMIFAVLAAILSILPKVTELPFGIDGALTGAVSDMNSFLAVFWPFAIVWTLFLWYLGIRAGVFLLKMILGSRSPMVV